MSPVRRFPSRVSSRLAFGVLAGLAAVVAPSFSMSPTSARAGDPPPAAAPAVMPRQAALEAVIHRLERHLAFLRKSRTELESGRPEPSAADDLARHRADVDRRGMREVSRYESARGKAVAALLDAEASKDPVKVGEAKAALDTLDSKFVDVMKKLEASPVTPPSVPGASKKAESGDATPPKNAESSPPKKASKPTGKSSNSGGPSHGDPASESDSNDDEDVQDDAGDDGDDDLAEDAAALHDPAK